MAASIKLLITPQIYKGNSHRTAIHIALKIKKHYTILVSNFSSEYVFPLKLFKGNSPQWNDVGVIGETTYI